MTVSQTTSGELLPPAFEHRADSATLIRSGSMKNREFQRIRFRLSLRSIREPAATAPIGERDGGHQL